MIWHCIYIMNGTLIFKSYYKKKKFLNQYVNIYVVLVKDLMNPNLQKLFPTTNFFPIFLRANQSGPRSTHFQESICEHLEWIKKKKNFLETTVCCGIYFFEKAKNLCFKNEVEVKNKSRQQLRNSSLIHFVRIGRVTSVILSNWVRQSFLIVSLL